MFTDRRLQLRRQLASGAQVRQSIAGNASHGFIKATDADGSVNVITIDGSGPGQHAYKLILK